MVKNKITYFIFLLAAALFAIFYNVYYTGILFIVAALLPLVLFLLLFITFWGISVDLDTNTPVTEKGENLSVTIVFQNRSIFPIPKLKLLLYYYNDLSPFVNKEKINLSLNRKSKQNITYHMTSNYCGNLIFNIKKVRIFDYFLIWSLRKSMNKSLGITVIPRLNLFTADIIAENNKAMNYGESFSEVKNGNDPTEVFRIREYRGGDRPNLIHWKLSYKQDQLIVKEFSDPVNNSVMILLELDYNDCYQDKLEYLDGLLECTASISYSCILKNHPHCIIWYDEGQGGCKQVSLQAEQDIYSVMQEMLKVKYPKTRHSIIAEFKASCFQEQYTHMIYITSVITEENIYAWTNSRGGVEFLLFYVNDLDKWPVSENIKHLLLKLQITLYEMDLKSMQNSIMAVS